jgi:hypothetical protein
MIAGMRNAIEFKCLRSTYYEIRVDAELIGNRMQWQKKYLKDSYIFSLSRKSTKTWQMNYHSTYTQISIKFCMGIVYTQLSFNPLPPNDL